VVNVSVLELEDAAGTPLDVIVKTLAAIPVALKVVSLSIVDK
jgi:hypothetical protein